MTPFRIPRKILHYTGQELAYMADAMQSGHLAGDGKYSRRCSQWLQQRTGSAAALLTPSCTASLELAAMLCDLHPGDEVIMPSFTFSSTATSFLAAGAIPVFADIDPESMNLDPESFARAISPKTRAVVPVHYAGCACRMDEIMQLARERGLQVVEDAAQGILAFDGERPLGSIGDFGCISFHESKNIQCGEGGCLLINDPEKIERAEIFREKGTDRSRFYRGQIDKYTWRDRGSSYLLSELNAAFLWAQLEAAEDIINERLRVFRRYQKLLASLEPQGLLRLPHPAPNQRHNAHIFYIICRSPEERIGLSNHLRRRGIAAYFHYIPLHSSPAGRRFGKTYGPLTVTDSLAACLLRLPLHVGMPESDIQEVAAAIHDYFEQ